MRTGRHFVSAPPSLSMRSSRSDPRHALVDVAAAGAASAINAASYRAVGGVGGDGSMTSSQVPRLATTRARPSPPPSWRASSTYRPNSEQPWSCTTSSGSRRRRPPECSNRPRRLSTAPSSAPAPAFDPQEGQIAPRCHDHRTKPTWSVDSSTRSSRAISMGWSQS
jgi:hypothetical protein